MHDSENDVKYLYKCLLKIHKNDYNISDVILKYMKKHNLFNNYKPFTINGKYYLKYIDPGTETYQKIINKIKNYKYVNNTFNKSIEGSDFYKIKKKKPII